METTILEISGKSQNEFWFLKIMVFPGIFLKIWIFLLLIPAPPIKFPLNSEKRP